MNHEAVDDIERRIALPRARIHSRRRHHDKIEIANDDEALAAEPIPAIQVTSLLPDSVTSKVITRLMRFMSTAYPKKAG